MNDEAGDILVTRDLTKHFPLRTGFNPLARRSRRFIKAVDGVSMRIPRGKTVAVVGESGCGKTTLAMTIAMLTPPTSGEVIFDGRNIAGGRVDRKTLYRNLQMVFQDPDSSLDPMMRVKDIIAEPLIFLMDAGRAQVDQAVTGSLEAVGLPADVANRLPRQLSGGQRQRVAIARAISPSPKLLILDEPTSALDVSVQAQIMNLLLELQQRLGLSYMLITHNISVAQYLSDMIAVMYSGSIVEHGATREVVTKPRHPYTIALVNAAPVVDPSRRSLLSTEITGEVPSAINPPSGCKFNPRCPYAERVCAETSPPLREMSPGHYAACHFVEKTA